MYRNIAQRERGHSVGLEDGQHLPDIHRAARLPQQTGQNQEAAQQHRARHAKHDICSQRYAAMVFLHVMPFRQL